MADRRRSDLEWQGRALDPERGNRRDVTERGRDMGRVRGYSGEDRGPGRGRDEHRGRGRSGGMRGSGFSDEDVGRYGRAYEYGGDEDLGRFNQDSREEYHRGGLMRGTPGHRRAGGPGDEFGEGFWSELTRERTWGDFDRYGARGAPRTRNDDTGRWSQGRDRGFGTRGYRDDAYQRTGYATSPTRDMDREMGHGAGRGGMQGAYPYGEQSSELPRQRGRGPRNYQRSDERIREDICDRLMQGWMDADDVTVRVDKGEVTLSGMVKSREEKRAIEDLAEEVLGVREVRNELRVAREQQREEDRGSRRDPGDQQGRQLHS